MTEIKKEDEQSYWANLVRELQGFGLTLERIAEEIGVSDRQVSNWTAGDRPKGLHALNLYLLHGKHKREAEPEFMARGQTSM